MVLERLYLQASESEAGGVRSIQQDGQAIIDHGGYGKPDRYSLRTAVSGMNWKNCRNAMLLLAWMVVLPIQPAAMADEVPGGGSSTIETRSFPELVAPCMTCHAIDADTRAYRVGPTLQGIVGRRVASLVDYEYSAALYQKAAVGAVWDERTLDRFLQSPQSMAPGVAMIYAGIADPDDRARLIAWLASGPAPLPVDALKAVGLRHVPQVKAVIDVQPDPEYGEYLAGGCLTCHSAPGASSSVPPIHGLPADYFINALLEYQQGERGNPVMQTMSAPLGKDELAALARYFSEPLR